MLRMLAAATAAFMLATNALAADDEETPPPTVVTAFAAGASVQPISISKVLIKLRKGETWAALGFGRKCDDLESVPWEKETSDGDAAYFNGMLEAELAKAGVMLARDNLFEDASTSANLEIGVVVKELGAMFCAESRRKKADIGAYAEMTVEWQVYDRLKQEVVLRLEIKSAVEGAYPYGAAATGIADDAFEENARQLLNTEDFRKIITTAPSIDAAKGEAAGDAPIALKGAALRRPVGEAAAAVVTVFAGREMGSGFLVSSDGYVLTNSHVVGAAKVVRIRWSDGVETLGEVVRSHKQRDVALIKTEPRGRDALALRRGPATPGEAVFAVGSPMDAALASTLTKGIVSANRTLNGQGFVQSDVAVSPGSSGGPLLDEKGEVVAVTVAAISLQGATVGLNFFIPIAEALDALALTPQT